MRETDIAWAAGLFEGEGATNYSGKYGVRFVVKMTDLDVLVRFQGIMGGKIYGPYTSKLSTKPWWECRIANWANVIEATKTIYPYLLSRRRGQIDALLSHAPKHPRGVLACPPEPIASYLGYDRHRKLKIPTCAVCHESMLMYFRERNRKAAALKKAAAGSH